MLKVFCPLFYILILCFSPLLIWIALGQLFCNRKIKYYQKLYKNNQLNNRIYARKCEVREVTDKKTIRKFLRQNHYFGVFINFFLPYKSEHKIIGLYYNDELVFLCCFKDNNTYVDCYAMCSKRDICVVGGASKCLNQIDKPIWTVSRKNSSEVYKTLGFEEEGSCCLLELMFGIKSDKGLFKYWRKA